VKEETARELVRTIAAEELPQPAWAKVTMRAGLEDEFAARRRPFAALRWVEVAVYAGLGVTLAAVALWLTSCG